MSGSIQPPLRKLALLFAVAAVALPGTAQAEPSVVEICRSDCSGDGAVNSSDVVQLLMNFGARDIPEEDRAGVCDSDSDGDVDSADYVNLMMEFGRRDCPSSVPPPCDQLDFGYLGVVYPDPDDPTLCWLDDPEDTGCTSDDLSCGRSVTVDVELLKHDSAQPFLADPHRPGSEHQWLTPPNPFGPAGWRKVAVSVYGERLTLSPNEGCPAGSEDLVLVNWNTSNGGIRFIEQPADGPYDIRNFSAFSEGEHSEVLGTPWSWPHASPRISGLFNRGEAVASLVSTGRWSWLDDPYSDDLLFNAHLLGLDEGPGGDWGPHWPQVENCPAEDTEPSCGPDAIGEAPAQEPDPFLLDACQALTETFWTLPCPDWSEALEEGGGLLGTIGGMAKSHVVGEICSEVGSAVVESLCEDAVGVTTEWEACLFASDCTECCNVYSCGSYGICQQACMNLEYGP